MNNKKTFIYIIKVSGSNIVKMLSGILIGFLLPAILGITDYGNYKTFALYVGYAGLFHFGFIDGIYLKYGGIEFNNLDEKLFRTYTSFFVRLEILVIMIIGSFAFVIRDAELRFITLCVALYIFANNITAYYQYISQCTGRFNELSFRNIIQSALTSVSVVILWFFHKASGKEISYRYYTIIYICIMIALSAWYVYTYRSISFGKRYKILEKKDAYFEIIKIGMPLLVSNLCTSLIINIDRQFVNILFDRDTYAIYAFAYNMLGLISTAISAISTVLYPTLKRANENSLKENYTLLVSAILVFVFGGIIVFYPLCWFISAFLPKYIGSLTIFRVILPGLAISSAVTIIMHNYYKTLGVSFKFFIKCVVILIVSLLANMIAFSLFRTTVSISVASIVVMVLWYLVSERYFVKLYTIKWVKNFAYILTMGGVFYGISAVSNWWIGMILYMISFSLITICFFCRESKQMFARK